MKLKPQDLEKISAVTLEHYERRADDFWQGTRGHGMQSVVFILIKGTFYFSPSHTGHQVIGEF